MVDALERREGISVFFIQKGQKSSFENINSIPRANLKCLRNINPLNNSSGVAANSTFKHRPLTQTLGEKTKILKDSAKAGNNTIARINKEARLDLMMFLKP